MSESSHPLRVSFRQGEGELEGQCWCGRTYTSPNPRQMWEWLDSHDHDPE